MLIYYSGSHIVFKMVADKEMPELLCRVNFPLYNVNMISPRHVMLSGGGGAANTGVRNGFVSIILLIGYPTQTCKFIICVGTEKKD